MQACYLTTNWPIVIHHDKWRAELISLLLSHIKLVSVSHELFTCLVHHAAIWELGQYQHTTTILPSYTLARPVPLPSICSVTPCPPNSACHWPPRNKELILWHDLQVAASGQLRDTRPDCGCFSTNRKVDVASKFYLAIVFKIPLWSNS
jgi:hypothetical protein